MTRTYARISTLAGAAFLALLVTGGGSASAADDAVKIRTADQGSALANGAVAVRVRVASAAKVELRASSPGVRRLSGRDQIGFDGPGSKKLNLLITGPGRSALEGASSRCEELTVLVKAEIDRKGRGKAGHETAERALSPDKGRCAKPAPGPGEDPAPGDGATPEPTPDPAPNPTPDPDPDPVETNLQAGAATADITPPVGTPMFAYTARSRIADPPLSPDAFAQVIADPAPDGNLYAKSFEPSEGIHTRLRASALVIERDDERFAFVQADLGGLPFALVQAVEERVSGIGIDAEHLLLSATHTHSGTGPIWPADSAGYQGLGGDFFDPRVFGLTADGIAEAIENAVARLEPSRVGVGTADLRGASSNREFETYQRNPEAPADLAAARDASIDPQVTVIRADGVDGQPLGLWSNFAIHQTSFGDGNLLLSGDNAATSERIVEREVARESGAPLPAPAAPGDEGGPVMVWTNAAEGDISPRGESQSPDGDALEYTQSDASKANLAGIRVARGVLDAWRDAAGDLSGDQELGARQTHFAFDGTEADGEPVGPIPVLGAAEIRPEPPEEFPQPPDETVCSPVDNVAGPGQGKKFPLLGGPGLLPQTASVSVFRIGELGVAAFPSEITVQMGRRITDAIGTESGGELDDIVIAGLTNGYMSYTATNEEYDGCTYEGSFTLFGRQQGARYRDVALSLVDPLLDGSAAPAGVPQPPTGFGTPSTPAIQAKPDAGVVVSHPVAEIRRSERATFSWQGGDPAVDAARGETFVSLQHLNGSEFETVATESGPEDATAFDESTGIWTETWQFSECDPLGTYRFRVTGRTVETPGGSAEPYVAESTPFTLARTAPIEVFDQGVSGTTARVRARYAASNPGDALLALARRVRSGEATIQLAGGGEVTATPDAQRLGFEASVPAGASMAGVSVEDGCGNSTG